MKLYIISLFMCGTLGAAESFTLTMDAFNKEYDPAKVRIQNSIIDNHPDKRLSILHDVQSMYQMPAVLFYGGPGTGKTEAAHGVMRRAKFEPYEINTYTINSGDYSETGNNLARYLFFLSEHEKKFGVFIDEADKIFDHPEATNRDTLTTTVALWKWIDYMRDEKRKDALLILAANDQKHFPDPLISRIGGDIFNFVGMTTPEQKAKAYISRYSNADEVLADDARVAPYIALFKKYPQFNGRDIDSLFSLEKNIARVERIANPNFSMNVTATEQACVLLRELRRDVEYGKQQETQQEQADRHHRHSMMMNGAGLGVNIAGVVIQGLIAAGKVGAAANGVVIP